MDKGTITGNMSAKATIAGFKDPATLTKWLNVFVLMGIILALLVLLSSFTQRTLLIDIKNQTFSSQSELNADAASSDLRHMLITNTHTAVSLVILVLLLISVHRANYNARALGATNLQYSPGWAVGCFFIPFACFVIPYQAVKEIWNASITPDSNKSGYFWVTVWWALMILDVIGCGVRVAVAKAISENQDIDTMIRGANIQIFIPAISALSYLTTLFVISKIVTMQMSLHRKLQAEVPIVVLTKDSNR